MKRYYFTRFFVLLFISLATISCKNKNMSFEKNLYPSKQITEFKDSTFFSDSYGIKFYSDKLYITDFDNGNIWVTDDNLNLLSTVGRYGEGPGEMTYCSKIDISRNYIFAADDGNRKINIYDINNGTYHNSIKYYYSGYSIDTRFAVSKDNFIFISKPSRIYSFDFSGKLINEFKLKIKSYWDKEQQVSGNRHVFIYKEKYLILVTENEPLIEIYTLSGRLINKFDLSGIEYLTNVLDYISNGNKPTHSSYSVIFKDAYLVDNFLYILYFDITKDGKKSLGKVMELEISEESYKLKNIYHLYTNEKVGWYDSFCVSDDRSKLFAFEGVSYEIQIFDLK